MPSNIGPKSFTSIQRLFRICLFRVGTFSSRRNDLTAHHNGIEALRRAARGGGIPFAHSVSYSHLHTNHYPRAQPSLKMLRGESGRALRPVLIPASSAGWPKLSGSGSRNTVCSPHTYCNADFEDDIGKVFISRTTKARTLMKHGPSARLVEPRLALSRDNSTNWIHLHIKCLKEELHCGRPFIDFS